MASFITAWSLGWLAGTACQLQQTQLWAMALYVVLGSLAGGLVCALVYRGAQVSKSLRWFAWCTAAMVLAFAQTGLRAGGYLAQAMPAALEDQTLQLEGVVTHMPQRMDDSLRFRFKVTTAQDLAGQAVMVPPQILLGWYGPWVGGDAGRASDRSSNRSPPADVRAGDRWRFHVRLKAPHGHLNPHGFDYELWLWEQGLQATGYVRTSSKDTPPQRMGSSWRHPVERLRQAAREAIDEQVPDRASAGIVAALLVGDQAAIDRVDWDVFRATGVAHLMAISGLHITGLAWLAAWCMGYLWRHSHAWWGLRRPLSLYLPAPLAAHGFGFAVALGYAVFTGWGVPAQRTVWMLAVVTGLRVYAKHWPWPQVWLWVCMVVLALDPWALLQAGFWLSFVAVGILFASGTPGSERQEETAPRSDLTGWQSASRTVWRAVRSMWREQWLMSICLAPLSLLLFHQISVVSLAANLLAVPWVTLVVTPLCLFGLLWALCWSWAAEALRLLMGLLQTMAAVSWVQWSAPAALGWAALAALLGMATWALRAPMWLRWYGVVLVLPALNWQAPRPSHGQFELLSADMGQGHAVLVRTAHHALLYDTGPRYSAETDAGQRVLVPLLRALGERLDRVIISHQDSDHSGGAAAVLAMQPQAEVLTSVPAEHRLQAMHPMHRCEQGQSWVWDGVVFTVLHPQAHNYQAKLKPNALSCVLRISSAAGVSALLVGDIEAAQERALVQAGLPVQADWLLVPHHGSATSSTPEFLQAVAPQVAMVQAGYRNRFGHPRADVMARYAERGVQVVQTTQCGASHWSSTAPEKVRCERELQQRYWHHRF